jgi:hypothetical protein
VHRVRHGDRGRRRTALSDDLLLTSRQRFARFFRYLGLASAPSVLLALVVLVDDVVVAGVIAGVGVFVGFSIATSVRSDRGALVAGTVVAVGLLVFQFFLAWLANHPILPGE